MTKDELRQKANDLPLAPGVYLMMDKTGKVIYVGKAKKLKNRVSQYFQDTASHNEKTRAMVSQVDHFDTIFVSTEFEALILENSLIKRHMPRYNILLKDDKGYPFVRLDEKAAYPRFSLVTRPAQDGARYFGPFGGRSETRQAIDAVCAALRLPTCSRRFPQDIGRERPCLNHHIGRCDGFCRPDGPDADEYRRRIAQAVRLFEGRLRQVTAELTARMADAAEALDWVVAQNEALPDGEKIRVVSVSAAPGNAEMFQNADLWDAAVARAEQAGLLVLTVDGAGVEKTRLVPYPAVLARNDRDNPAACRSGFADSDERAETGSNTLSLPCSYRTVAEEYTAGQYSYTHDGHGGLSWGIPYCAGVMALGWQVDPTLTGEEMMQYLLSTAATGTDGSRIIDPVQFIQTLQTERGA